MKYTIIIAVGIFFSACNNSVQTGAPEIKSPVQSAVVAIDSAASSSPSLTKDPHGNIVLSWTRALNDSVSILCYAVSAGNGKSFGKTIPVPSSMNVDPHGENMPKLVMKPSGEIIAIWGVHNPNPKNKYSGMVYFSQSFDKGKTWSNSRPLVKDTASFDQRYFDVAVLPNGEAGIVWLDNRINKSKDGSAIYFAQTSGPNGFQAEKRIGEPCCECCRTDLFVDSKKNIHVVYRAIMQDSIRDMVHIISTDQGSTFSTPQRLNPDNWVINGCPHTGPAITENEAGLHFAWFTMGTGNGLYYCNTKDNGKTFSPRDSIRITTTARHPQITALPNGNTFIVWDETASSNDKFHSSIGLQQRSPEGKQIMTQIISSDSGRATFPVVQPIDDNTIILSYNKTINDRPRVVYETISF